MSCHCEDDIYISLSGVRDEDLRSVQDVIIAILYRRRLLSGCIRTGIWLCQTKSGQLLACAQIRQILFLLLRRTELNDRPCAQRCMSGQYDTGRTAFLAQFLYCEDVAQVISTCASVFTGIRDAQHLACLHLFNGFSWETFFFVGLCCKRLHFFFSKFSE